MKKRHPGKGRSRAQVEKLAVRFSSIMGVLFILGAVLYLTVWTGVETEADLVVGDRPWTRWSMDRPVIWARVVPDGYVSLLDGPEIAMQDFEHRLGVVHMQMAGAPLLVFLDAEIPVSFLTPIIEAANNVGVRYVTIASREPEPEYFDHWRRQVPPDLLAQN